VKGVRARLTLDRIALAVVVVGAILLVASLVEGSSSGSAPDEAVRLVPPDALLYVHARVAPDGAQWERAGEIVRTLPALRRLRDRVLDSVSRERRRLNFETQVRPWIGDEAALALLRDGSRATSLILLRSRTSRSRAGSWPAPGRPSASATAARP
jgi:hypothetical protein